MAEMHINKKKIISNIKKLSSFLNNRGMQWTMVTKLLCGDKDILKELISDPVIKLSHSVGDSRISSLKTIKKFDPNIVTMYIKPPAMDIIRSIVSYADISLNTSFKTLEAINAEAKRQNKKHRTIIMIELGELREGVLRERVVDFYKRVFQLSNIEVEGLGTNLGCMYGIEPTYDKLIQLSLYKQLLESVFEKQIPLISGGSSITLPLIKQKKIPNSVNHFRVGEAVFCGTTPFDNNRFSNLNIDAFEYYGNIIELEEKEIVPDGVIGEGNVGHAAEFNEDEIHKKTTKAILDFGVLDANAEDLKPKDPSIKFVGTTSDLTVYDLGSNLDSKGNVKYHVGTQLPFIPGYMGSARLMNSKFIKKVIK